MVVPSIGILVIRAAIHILLAGHARSYSVRSAVEVGALIPPALGLPWDNSCMQTLLLLPCSKLIEVGGAGLQVLHALRGTAVVIATVSEKWPL